MWLVWHAPVGRGSPVELNRAARFGHIRRPGQRRIATRTYHTPRRRDPQPRTRTRSGILCSPSRLGTVSVPDLIRDTAHRDRAVGGFLTGWLTLKLEGYEK